MLRNPKYVWITDFIGRKSPSRRFFWQPNTWNDFEALQKIEVEIEESKEPVKNSITEQVRLLENPKYVWITDFIGRKSPSRRFHWQPNTWNDSEGLQEIDQTSKSKKLE